MEAVQDTFLRLIGPLYFGNADGADIVRALDSERGQWIAVYPDHSAGSGRVIAALPRAYAVDTLYILCHRYRAPRMREVIEDWQPSEVTTLHDGPLRAFLGRYDEAVDDLVLLRIWWKIKL